MDNTHFIQITGTGSGLLSAFPVVNYFDAFFFKSVDFETTFTYPTTTFGGPLTAGAVPVPIPDRWNGGVVFTEEVSGGPMVNYSYEDFSALNSSIFIGNYFCTPTIVLSFSSYDESKSPVNKIIYNYKGEIGALNPHLSSTKTVVKFLTSVQISPTQTQQVEKSQVFNTFFYAPPKDKLVTLNPSPGVDYFETNSIYLSVLKFDGTVNTFTLNFNLFQCELLELYGSANIINSQLLASPEYVLLTLENSDSKQVYNSILNTDIPFALLTGGDTVQLAIEEAEPDVVFELEQEQPTETIFLANQIAQQALPPEVPIPEPEINPINPNLAEYYYRGEKGIRIRPLLARLLPREEFFYERPYSGLVLLSGGAPYYPGSGIRFKLEFRVI